MKHHQFDLRVGESIRLGDYKVTLLEVDGGEAVLEIEGPEGEIHLEPVIADTVYAEQAERELVHA